LSTIIELKDIKKTYHLGENTLHVLKDVNFHTEKGELVSLVGASGSGKSTLMNIIGLLDHANSGSYHLLGREIHDFSPDEAARIRNRTIGFVFQQFFLLPRLSALQNVALPLLYRNVSQQEKRELPLQMLAKVGMADYAQHKPSELSGGQQQRVAIARALVTQPEVILADEPTGSLDSVIGQEVMDLFLHLNTTENTTIIIITHDNQIAAQCSRIVRISDGNIISEGKES